VDYQQFLERGTGYFLPNLSIDIVIIGYEQGALKCLLLKIHDKWILPGGYIQREESVDTAAARILRARTGLEDPHLKFLSVFGDNDRRFGDEIREFFARENLTWREEHWVNHRFVTLAYYSLVDIEKTTPVPGELDEAFAWFDFDELPAMWMDHASIAKTARNRLKEDILQEHITYELLPSEFTMPQLHQLHQVIMGETIDRSRFQKKMLSSEIFERLPQRKRDTPGRTPYHYRVKDKN
jgi:ADP-ribose pyrophosphatase YjhB (NUDIX family)